MCPMRTYEIEVVGRSYKPLSRHGSDDPEQRLNGNVEPACLVICMIITFLQSFDGVIMAGPVGVVPLPARTYCENPTA